MEPARRQAILEPMVEIINLHTEGKVLVKLLGMKGLEVERKVATSGREGLDRSSLDRH